MERSKNVPEAKKGLTLEAEKKEENSGVSEWKPSYAKLPTNYKTPPIPEGYRYVCGEWKNGYVIERKSDESQFVWIPVGYLDPNGTLEGFRFTKRFGRRKFGERVDFSPSVFHEDPNDDLMLQLGSVKKYGGFYISRYAISLTNENKLQSVKGKYPLCYVRFYDAMVLASKFENRRTVKSHLPFGAEFDSVLEWFMKSGARKRSEITKDSSNWGNYSIPHEVFKTGSNEEWCTNNIYDFAGNVEEWTQENCGEFERTIRGGFGDVSLGKYPVCSRISVSEKVRNGFPDVGFRVSLYIK